MYQLPKPHFPIGDGEYLLVQLVSFTCIGWGLFWKDYIPLQPALHVLLCISFHRVKKYIPCQC